MPKARDPMDTPIKRKQNKLIPRREAFIAPDVKEFNAWAANFLNQSRAKVINIISNWLAQRNERETKINGE
jgi:hypothetical protein